MEILNQKLPNGAENPNQTVPKKPYKTLGSRQPPDELEQMRVVAPDVHMRHDPRLVDLAALVPAQHRLSNDQGPMLHAIN